MNTHKKYKTTRNIINAAALTLGMTLLVTFAGAQEVAGGGANKDDHAYKGGMREMPRIKEAGVVTVKGNENWDDTLGFGKDSDMAEMMTLMMVGGSGMEHMKMPGMRPGMKMDAKAMQNMKGMKSGMKGVAMDAQGLPVSVALAQNPPAMGENTLDVVVKDSGGKPVTGLKLMATVAMTSMDMGIERPKAVEGKDGHYSVPVTFSMKGPWRVTLLNDGKADKAHSVHTALDFNVDGKTKWKMTGAQDTAQPDTAAGAAGAKTLDTTAQAKPQADSTRQAVDTPATLAPIPAKTATADEKTTAKAVDDKATKTGDTPAAQDTAKPAPDKAAADPTPGYKVTLNTPLKSVKVGKNMLDVTVLDADGKPVVGAKVTAAVEMTSMDMGVTRPKAKEDKAGHYLAEVTFSMKGPWRVTMTVAPPKQKPFTKAIDFNVPK